MVSQKTVYCRVSLEKEGGKKKMLEMPKCTEAKQPLGNSGLLEMLSTKRGT